MYELALRPSVAFGGLPLLALGTILLLSSPATAQNKKNKNKNQPKQEEVAEKPDFSSVDSALDAWDLGRAEKTLNKMDAGLSDAKVRKARLLAQRGSLGEAAKQLEQVTAENGKHAAAWNWLGEVRLWRDQRGPATEAFRRAEEAAKSETSQGGADAWLQLGIARQRLERYDGAMEALKKAEAKQPKNVEVRYQIGRTLAFQEKFQPAVDALSRAIDGAKDHAYSYYYRGMAYGRVDEKSKMIEDLERFLALAPDAPESERVRRIVNSTRR